MEFWAITMLLTYIAIMGFVLPGATVGTDIFKVKIRLLPYWFKFVSFVWFFAVLCYSIQYVAVRFLENNFLVTGINLALLLIAVSRDKKEDEFSNQIRLRSMYLSAILLFYLTGFSMSLLILSPNLTPGLKPSIIMMILNGALLVYLTNYYLSKYFFNR